MRKALACIGDFLKQILFPRRCPVCDDIVIPYGKKICVGCHPKLKLLAAPYCMKCGKKMMEEGERCSDCKNRTHEFIRGRALYEYGSAALSIYRFKYCARREYADFYGEEMAFYLGSFLRKVRPDALIPIPLHRRRLNVRGYNQAALLAGALGKQAGIPVKEKYLKRVRNTTPLKLLNPKERQNNLKRAFIIDKNDVKLKTVIVVDDIYTTGSTIDEAARALKAGGVERVYFVTLASGTGI